MIYIKGDVKKKIMSQLKILTIAKYSILNLISIRRSKTDRCDFCEEHKVKKKGGIPISTDEEANYVKHQSEKVAMRNEK